MIALVVGLAGAGTMGVQRLLRRRRERAWEAAATKLGLKATEVPRPVFLSGEDVRTRLFTREVSGEVDQIHVTASVLGKKFLRYTRISAASIRMNRQVSFDVDSPIQHGIAVHDPIIGDPEFDKAVRMTGDEAACASVLDAATRVELPSGAKHALLAAVRAIQDRVGELPTGALAVVEDAGAEGSLSMVEPKHGDSDVGG